MCSRAPLRVVFLLLLVLAGVAACGKKGPLYLPPPDDTGRAAQPPLNPSAQ